MPRHHRSHVGLGPHDMALNATRGTPNESDIEQPLMDNGYDDIIECGNGYSSSLLYERPAETLKWIEQEGVRKLGTFKVRVSVQNFLRISSTSVIFACEETHLTESLGLLQAINSI